MDNKKILIIGGLCIISVLSLGFYYFLKKKRKIQLSHWIEEYSKEIEGALAANKENLSVETIVSIFKLCSELEDYLYLNENHDLELERLDKINEKEVYEHLVYETEKRKDKCTTEAVEYLEQRLGISFNRLYEILKDVDKKEITRNNSNCEKLYNNLPIVTKQKLRDAYKEYVQSVLTCNDVMKKQLGIVERDPKYESTAMKIIHLNRYLMEDTIRKNYGIRPKYFNQLLNEHRLLDEPEIKFLHDTFMALG
jgi:hypothetical protein